MSALSWVDEHIEKVVAAVLEAEQECPEPTEHHVAPSGSVTLYDVARVLERLRELALRPRAADTHTATWRCPFDCPWTIVVSGPEAFVRGPQAVQEAVLGLARHAAAEIAAPAPPPLDAVVMLDPFAWAASAIAAQAPDVRPIHNAE